MTASDRYASIVRPGVPHLWVKYEKVDDKDQLSWGVDGRIQHPILIAGIVRTQVKLCAGAQYRIPDGFDECPESKFVIAWPSLDSESEVRKIKNHDPYYFMHQDVPRDHLLCILETAKSMLLAGMLMANQQRQMTENRVRPYGKDGQIIN